MSPKKTIAEIIRQFNEEQLLPPVVPKHPGVDVAELIRLYVDEGLTLQEVGMRLGVSRKTVRLKLKTAGISIRPNTPAPPPTIPRYILKRLYVAQNLTLNKIGAKLGFSNALISSWVKYYGLKRLRVTDHPKYKPIHDLKIGESIVIENVDPAYPGTHSRDVAKQIGIKVRVQRLDETTVKVRRVG